MTLAGWEGALEERDYASNREVIRKALLDWKMKREVRMHQLAELTTEISRGMADVNAARMAHYDSRQIIALGKKLSAARAKSASPKKQK